MRSIHTPEELYQMERLQEAVWDKESVVPLHMTLTLQKCGAIYLGAFDGDEMIGFLYSFAGKDGDGTALFSHMLGFYPDYRRGGLGAQMKWLQREEAIKQGYHKIKWTYDPLETVNANLNISKLGGIVRTYIPNCYGDLDDDMNRGLPTDRFMVEWLINSKRVENRRTQAERPSIADNVPSILVYQKKEANIPVPISWNPDVDADTVAVPVPGVFQEVKRHSMDIARDWRKMTGELFQHYFSKGYIVSEVIRHPQEPVVSYLLQKGVDLE